MLQSIGLQRVRHNWATEHHHQQHSCFTMLLVSTVIHSKVNHLHIYIYAFFFGFPSHVAHHRVLCRVPCAVQ